MQSNYWQKSETRVSAKILSVLKLLMKLQEKRTPRKVVAMDIRSTFVAYHCTSAWELSTIGDGSLNVDVVVLKMTRDLLVMNCNVNMIHLSEIPQIHRDGKPLWIITYKYINLKEDWKCHKKHTCKVNCILLSFSDHVGKGFLTRVAGFHTFVVSAEFIVFPQGKTKQKNAIATCKKNIMHGGIWNAHFMRRSMQE